MNHSCRHHSYGKILFSGILLLGTGIVAWAGYHIFDQSTYAAIPVYISDPYVLSSPIHKGELSDRDIAAKEAEGFVESGALIALTPPMERTLYQIYPSKGEVIGSIEIPDLDRVLPIIEGTSEEELKNGVGHFTGSALPGENSNCVLSGHRDSVFIGVGDLKLGDRLIVQTAAGTFNYEIIKLQIVHKDDTTIIVPSDHAMLTLTTCYPFIFIGHAPDRYIISANLVKDTEYP